MFANTLLAHFDQQIRRGDFAGARRDLRARLDHPVDRADAVVYAEVARRTGQHEIAFQLLHRWMRPSARTRAAPPSDPEILEYAATLINMFAIREAEAWLTKLRSPSPRADFLRGFARMHAWDYPGAITHLEKFIGMSDPKSYAHLVGRVNLGLALIQNDQFESAAKLIRENIDRSRSADAHVLLANSLESLAHLQFLNNEDSGLAETLMQAHILGPLDKASTRDARFLEKWQVLAECRQSPDRAHLKRARLFQKSAAIDRDFETVRAMDFHLGILYRDPKLLLRNFFGTPFENHRRRIRVELARIGVIEIPRSWAWVPGGSNDRGRSEVKVPIESIGTLGQLPSRALFALAADHYRPLPLGALHAALYPDQPYLRKYSADQTHQVLSRLREIFRRSALDLGVTETRSAYRLEGNAQVILSETLDTDHSKLERFCRGLDNRAYRSQELANLWQVSKPTALARAKLLVTEGKWQQEGAGPQLRYRVK